MRAAHSTEAASPMHRSTKIWRHSLIPPEPQPRTFAELHAERAYLLSCLQHENDKATELLKRVLPLEEALMHTMESRERREAKKKLGWLRCRVRETTRQEKAVLARLGQVSYEIQSRERWTQVEIEHQQQAYNFASPHLIQNMQYDMPPYGYQPQPYYPPYDAWTAEQHGIYNSYSWQPSIHDIPEESIYEEPDNPTETEASGLPIEDSGNETEQTVPLERRSLSMERTRSDVLTDSSPQRNKRHSF